MKRNGGADEARASERARARALAPRNETSLQKYSLLTNVEGARQQGGRRGEDVDILSFSRATKWNSGEADPRTGARSVRSMKFYSVTMKHVPLQPILAGYSRLLEDNKENCPLSLSLSLSFSLLPSGQGRLVSFDVINGRKI